MFLYETNRQRLGGFDTSKKFKEVIHMIKGDKGKMPVIMLKSKKRPEKAVMSRTKAAKRHLLANMLKAKTK